MSVTDLVCPLPIGPPEIEAGYLDRYVAQVGDTVKLNCPIIGTPKPIIEWYQVRRDWFPLFPFIDYELPNVRVGG